jgi:fucose permease
VLALAFASFLLFGVALVIVGANQAALAAALGLDLSASGLLVSTLSLGIGVGVLSTGPIVDRAPRRPLFVAVSAGSAACLAATGPDAGFARTLACLFGLGACLGGYETILNTVIAERHGSRAARPLTFVHAGATLGAVLGAPLVAWIAARADWSASFRATGVAFALVGLAGLAASFGRGGAPQDRAADGVPARGLSFGIAPYAGVAACYVGLETAVTIFAAPYAQGALGLAPARGVRAISAFWLGLLLGRALFLLHRGPVDARLLAGAGLAAALALGAGAALGVRALELWVGIVGLLLGLVFPVFVALTALRFSDARGTATGLVTGAGALGGFAVPWLTGVLGDARGIRVAFASLTAWCLALALFAALARPGERAHGLAARSFSAQS